MNAPSGTLLNIKEISNKLNMSERTLKEGYKTRISLLEHFKMKPCIDVPIPF